MKRIKRKVRRFVRLYWFWVSLGLIPELSDMVYTRNSILQECNQQDDLAEEVFETLDWQHVSSLLEDWFRNGELDTCKECGKMFNCYGVTKCPYCGADYKGGDD